MICLYVQAPYGVFRTFTAGSFRPTAGFITPSAAYGLLLNISGIESRLDDDKQPMTLMRENLPHAKIALGALRFPQVHNLYQQMYNYPVGKDAGAKYALRAKGSKYNITPVRREFLSDIRAYICLEDSPDLADRIKEGLAGKYNMTRYGVPFLGDNNFLIDILREETDRRPAYWYEKISEQGLSRPHPRTTRLTIMIDRRDMANTMSALFCPCLERRQDIPEKAWITIPA